MTSKHYYFDIFNTRFNIAFFKPKKDQCDCCEGYKNATDEKKEELRQSYAAHIENKKQARQIKKQDKELAKQNDDTCIICFDFQKVLTTPKTEASSLYYKRKLSTYNFTIYDIARHKAM